MIHEETSLELDSGKVKIKITVESELTEAELFKLLYSKTYGTISGGSIKAFNILALVQLKVTNDSLPKLHKL